MREQRRNEYNRKKAGELYNFELENLKDSAIENDNQEEVMTK